MSDKRTLYLAGPEQRQRAFEAIAAAPKGAKVVVSDPNRSLDQNAAQWPILQAFAEQLRWPVNGQMVQMTDEEWKDVLTAAFKGEAVRLAQGLNGGVVMLGQRTSKFSKGKFSEWLEFLHAVAVERGVYVHAEDAALMPTSDKPAKPVQSQKQGVTA